MLEERLYVFADPFNSVTSGVTAYIRDATRVLSQNGWKSIVIRIEPSESIAAFRERLSREVQSLGERLWMIEAPESLAASASIPFGFPLHIRLHLSRQLGKMLQGHRAQKHELVLEQREIARAAYISAPSQSAVELSRIAFELPDTVICGNPIADFTPSAKAKRFAGLFIGRWQALKGVDMLLQLCSYSPEKKIGVITDRNIDLKLPGGMELLAVGSIDAKRDLIRESSCVIVPSLFETASMVGLEALSLGTPVVTWSHVGLTEYAGSPLVHAVQPFDLSQFVSAMDKIRDLPIDHDVWCGRVAEINGGYLKAIKLMNQGDSFAGTFGLLPPPNTQWKKIIGDYRERFMTKNTKSSFSRKFRKLRRDPVAFFRDSWIADIFIPPGSKLQINEQAARIDHATSKSCVAMRDEESNAIVFAKDRGTVDGAALLPAPKDGASQIVLPEELVRQAVPVGPDLECTKPLRNPQQAHLNDPSVQTTSETRVKDGRSSFAEPLFADIADDRRIIFGDVENRRIGWRVGFFYSEKDCDLAAELISRMDQFDDFSHLRKKNIYVGRFDMRTDISVLAIINKIDVANKARVSAIDHIVLLNAPVNLQNALRACGTKQKIIVVDTLGKGSQSASPDADVLITLSEGRQACRPTELRKAIVVNDRRMLPFAIRRAVQEGGPKTPDMLIPLVGRGEFNPEFLSFDVTRFQGIIRLNAPAEFKASSLEKFCAHLVSSVEDIYILDSVYCQYRSMCEDVEDGAGLASFLCATLKDGILFDVQH